jgi:hypothetical protein
VGAMLIHARAFAFDVVTLLIVYKTGRCTREKCVSVKNTVHTLEFEVGECRIYMVSLT